MLDGLKKAPYIIKELPQFFAISIWQQNHLQLQKHCQFIDKNRGKDMQLKEQQDQG